MSFRILARYVTSRFVSLVFSSHYNPEQYLGIEVDHFFLVHRISLCTVVLLPDSALYGANQENLLTTYLILSFIISFQDGKCSLSVSVRRKVKVVRKREDVIQQVT